eukprot:TRINITY_DN18772_c0_g1_i1.p1 TRINITY_DN18772_c0_g1~~TRINITY_DN18772_c0_g1_i1.p1  ORF type:complete len:112 (+),score=15.73 TRINITY_DN18772_c0_g1_i1:51-386(+)
MAAVLHPCGVNDDFDDVLPSPCSHQQNGCQDIEDAQSEVSSVANSTNLAPDLEASVFVKTSSAEEAPTLQDNTERPFLERIPDGLSVWKSFLLTMVICVIAGTLQFVVVPN